MGKTILFVSHDLSSISRYCDRVILLNKGVKLEEGSPKQMVDMYKQLLVGQDPAKAEEKKEEQKESMEPAVPGKSQYAGIWYQACGDCGFCSSG